MQRSKVLAVSRENGKRLKSADAVVWVMYRHGPAVLQEDPFLVQVDGDDDDEEVMEMEDTEMVKEVGRSSILHWNYRNLTHLPQELLGECWQLIFCFLLNLQYTIYRPRGSHPGDLPERKPD